MNFLKNNTNSARNRRDFTTFFFIYIKKAFVRLPFYNVGSPKKSLWIYLNKKFEK